MPIINGRRVNIPSPTIEGQALIEMVNPGNGRRAVILSGMDAKTIEPNKKYSVVDNKGREVKASSIPDRTKGSFWGVRSEHSKKIITEQVYDLAENLFKKGLDFDEEMAHWMMVPKYVLPEIWHDISNTTPLLIVFPTEYPEQPPIGFYLKAELEGSGADGHLHSNVYYEAAREPLDEGWKWYCVHINAGSWQPARVRQTGDWKRGDNLWTYFTLIREALSTRGA